MRTRYKWPGGTGIITLGDDATLGDVVKELTSKTFLTDFGIKFGPPTAMKALDMSRVNQSAKEIGIHGETLTIVPNEKRPPPSRQSTGEDRRERHQAQQKRPQDINVPWDVRDGTLVLRVMPSDNSCLFTAFGGALPQQTQNLISFGEGKRDQCILVYSGIHYDRIAFSYSEHPYTDPTLPPEMDRTTWPVEDEEVLIKAKDLVGKLHGAHYFTNMDGLVLKCNVAGCGWIGSGQADGQRHAEETGHTQLSEIIDTQTEAVLRKCNVRGCDFIGQGDSAARQHSQDTRHDSYSVIEDW
ncbi:Ovarian tumor, otubain [Akanthomyces lecanii RCEF 1005]|uniref:Ubiquitin thioesterase OTU n=1 Tax=Akanthomyces lecanii RCEF 1005 TaxID=1081108 RepID=A0A162KFW5_CORDF|nr:Ovarian tumor, otubain [Akanthomyces lecanii RCEF 1005]